MSRVEVSRLRVVALARVVAKEGEGKNEWLTLNMRFDARVCYC